MIKNKKTARVETFKRNVEAAIRKVGGAPNALVSVIGCHHKTIYEWKEQGRHRAFGPAFPHMKKLADLLGYKDVEGLFVLEPEPPTISSDKGPSRIKVEEVNKGKIPVMSTPIIGRVEIVDVFGRKDSPYKNLLYVRERMRELDNGEVVGGDFDYFRQMVEEVGGWDTLVGIMDVLKQLKRADNGRIG